jgi:hypothetical protein
VIISDGFGRDTPPFAAKLITFVSRAGSDDFHRDRQGPTDQPPDNLARRYT